MPALSNEPVPCEVLNLGYGPQGRGPYLVRQEGYVPGGTSLHSDQFILQKDGRWLLNLVFAALPEAEQERQLFHDLGELSAFLDALAASEVLADASLPSGANHEELLQRFESCTHRILQGIRNSTSVQARG